MMNNMCGEINLGFQPACLDAFTQPNAPHWAELTCAFSAKDVHLTLTLNLAELKQPFNLKFQLFCNINYQP